MPLSFAPAPDRLPLNYAPAPSPCLRLTAAGAPTEAASPNVPEKIETVNVPDVASADVHAGGLGAAEQEPGADGTASDADDDAGSDCAVDFVSSLLNTVVEDFSEEFVRDQEQDLEAPVVFWVTEPTITEEEEHAEVDLAGLLSAAPHPREARKAFGEKRFAPGPVGAAVPEESFPLDCLPPSAPVASATAPRPAQPLLPSAAAIDLVAALLEQETGPESCFGGSIERRLRPSLKGLLPVRHHCGNPEAAEESEVDVIDLHDILSRPDEELEEERQKVASSVVSSIFARILAQEQAHAASTKEGRADAAPTRDAAARRLQQAWRQWHARRQANARRSKAEAPSIPAAAISEPLPAHPVSDVQAPTRTIAVAPPSSAPGNTFRRRRPATAVPSVVAAVVPPGVAPLQAPGPVALTPRPPSAPKCPRRPGIATPRHGSRCRGGGGRVGDAGAGAEAVGDVGGGSIAAEATNMPSQPPPARSPSRMSPKVAPFRPGSGCGGGRRIGDGGAGAEAGGGVGSDSTAAEAIRMPLQPSPPWQTPRRTSYSLAPPRTARLLRPATAGRQPSAPPAPFSSGLSAMAIDLGPSAAASAGLKGAPTATHPAWAVEAARQGEYTPRVSKIGGGTCALPSLTTTTTMAGAISWSFRTPRGTSAGRKQGDAFSSASSAARTLST